MDQKYVYELFEFLHNHAELGFQEFETSAFLASELKKAGYQVTEHVDGKTGVIGVLDSKKPGKTLVLRADMDALPYETDGKVTAKHTCGHDAHSAMVMAAAKYFSEHGIPSGKLKIVFQPAEETLRGALSILHSGLIDDADEMLGIHIRTREEISFGQASAGVCHGASSRIDITVHGVSAHGARPHQGVNAIEAAVEIINAVHAIRVDPRVSHTVKVTRFFGGGDAINIIPDKAVISFDIRSQTNDIMDILKNKIKNAAIHAAAALDATADVLIEPGVPAAKFDSELLADAETSIGEVLGTENIAAPIITPGGEDFHFYARHLPHCKTAFIGLGTDSCPGLHHRDMQFRHESLENGVNILISVIKRRFHMS